MEIKEIQQIIRDMDDNKMFSCYNEEGCLSCVGKRLCSKFEYAENLYKQNYRKIGTGCVLINKELLIQQVQYLEGRAVKGTVYKYSKGVVSFISKLFENGKIDFATKVSLLKENEKLQNNFVVKKGE